MLKDVANFDHGPGGSSWQAPYWSIWRNHFGGSNLFVRYSYSAKLEEPEMFSDHTNGTLQSHLPSRSIKTPPRIHVSHRGSGKLALQDYFPLQCLISERKDSFVHLQSHFNNKIKKPTPTNWCLGGILTKISLLLMVPSFWSRVTSPNDTCCRSRTSAAEVKAMKAASNFSKERSRARTSQAKQTSWVVEGYIGKKHVQGTTSYETNLKEVSDVFLFLGDISFSNPNMIVKNLVVLGRTGTFWQLVSVFNDLSSQEFTTVSQYPKKEGSFCIKNR